MTWDDFNHLSLADAKEELLRCCGSRRWAEAVASSRPFANRDALFTKADRVWRELSSHDWLEAFGSHPKIGAKVGAPKPTAQWAAEEQKGTTHAPEGTLSKLAGGNVSYEQKFGYIFIICATGKTADEMLAQLEARLHHTPQIELGIAAGEQAKITRIRLEKLLS